MLATFPCTTNFNTWKATETIFGSQHSTKNKKKASFKSSCCSCFNFICSPPVFSVPPVSRLSLRSSFQRVALLRCCQLFMLSSPRRAAVQLVARQAALLTLKQCTPRLPFSPVVQFKASFSSLPSKHSLFVSSQLLTRCPPPSLCECLLSTSTAKLGTESACWHLCLMVVSTHCT